MIRVNLGGATSKKPSASTPSAKAPTTRAASGPTSLLPIVHLLILVAAAVGGYLYYTKLSAENADLTSQISALQEKQRELDAVIKQNQIYEVRKKALESRIKVIEDLKKNQLSPVVVLDALAEAIDKTRFVWLSSLSQTNSTFSMAGTGTSVDALSAFVANLKGTGYFRNINLARFSDAHGNYTFSMTCDFLPPSYAPEKGAN
jgi:type IV pilus assembly protein PilN